MGQDNNQQVIVLRWPASDYYIICNRFALIKQVCKGFILEKMSAIKMIFLLLVNIYNNHKVISHTFGTKLCRSMKMYCLILMLYREIDAFLSLNDDPIRIPKTIFLICKLFYNETAIRSLSDSQNCKEKSASLPSVTS